ncbi:Uncharacterised protein [Halioglobus japonicus]|nr:Uncharacterised protein [Halioglobus japonicus]
MVAIQVAQTHKVAMEEMVAWAAMVVLAVEED